MVEYENVISVGNKGVMRDIRNDKGIVIGYICVSSGAVHLIKSKWHRIHQKKEYFVSYYIK